MSSVFCALLSVCAKKCIIFLQVVMFVATLLSHDCLRPFWPLDHVPIVFYAFGFVYDIEIMFDMIWYIRYDMNYKGLLEKNDCSLIQFPVLILIRAIVGASNEW